MLVIVIWHFIVTQIFGKKMDDDVEDVHCPFMLHCNLSSPKLENFGLDTRNNSKLRFKVLSL